MWAALRAGQEGGQILKSEMITRDVRRRYYVDLKENRRGRFVRFSQVSTATNQRDQIAVPAPDGIAQLHAAVDELLRSVGATQRARLPLHLNYTQLNSTPPKLLDILLSAFFALYWSMAFPIRSQTRELCVSCVRES